MLPTLAWQNIADIARELAERYPQRDPLSVRFTELRQLVESLPNFTAQPGHPCNESILEAIQAAWHEEKEDAAADDDDHSYHPADPFRPQT